MWSRDSWAPNTKVKIVPNDSDKLKIIQIIRCYVRDYKAGILWEFNPNRDYTYRS